MRQNYKIIMPKNNFSCLIRHFISLDFTFLAYKQRYATSLMASPDYIFHFSDANTTSRELPDAVLPHAFDRTPSF